MKKGIAIFAAVAALAGVACASFIGSEFDMPSVRVETITVSSEGVVGFSDAKGRDYEMKSPVKSLIVPSWRYAISGRWELRGAYPVRVVSENDIEMLEIAIPKSWGGNGKRTSQNAPPPSIKLPGGKKLMTVTWKSTKFGEEMWFLTRDFRKGDLIETYEFRTKSGNGKVTIEETQRPRPW